MCFCFGESVSHPDVSTAIGTLSLVSAQVQSFMRGWLCRRKWKIIVQDYICSPHAESMRKRNQIVFNMVEAETEYANIISPGRPHRVTVSTFFHPANFLYRSVWRKVRPPALHPGQLLPQASEDGRQLQETPHQPWWRQQHLPQQVLKWSINDFGWLCVTGGHNWRIKGNKMFTDNPAYFQGLWACFFLPGDEFHTCIHSVQNVVFFVSLVKPSCSYMRFSIKGWRRG